MKIIYALIFSIALSASLQAQISKEEMRTERQEKMQSRIESQKVAFITQKLDLTTEEAQKFWPVYNEFQNTLKDFRRQNRMDLKYEDINDSDANTFLDNLFSREQEELDIKKSYYNKLQTTISPKKVAQLYIIEKKFREEILSSIRSRMGKKKRKNRRNGF